MTDRAELSPKQFHFKDQRGIGWNSTTGTAGAISQTGGDDQFPLAADLHALYAFVPALDHAPCPQREGEGLASIDRAVEFLPVFQPACIVHDDGLAGLGGRSRPDFVVDILQA